jgi:hypothetical protein
MTTTSEVVGNDVGSPVVDTTYSGMRVIHDEITTSGIEYVGIAKGGTLDGDPRWHIYIIDRTSGMEDKKSANSNDKANKVWNDRVGYTYG